MTKTILLTTLNSTYQHSAFGLRYLFANLGPLQQQTQILEFTISQNPRDIAENILLHKPKIIGFGIYIWNVHETQQVIEILKSIAPEIIIVLGGPEVSHESESQTIVQIADHTIKGEADFLFPQLCQDLLSGTASIAKIISQSLPEIKKINLPYSYYTEEDIKNRIIYVEASRGCPYKCEYCLSSLDKSVRNFELNIFLQEMDLLITKGVRQFKFVDRTFNLSPTISTAILKFFLEKAHLGLFLHFELVPDRLPDELKALIEQFPKGSLQFEIGIQTFNPQVAANVSRRQDYKKIQENLIYLKEKTHVHTHVDLIIGLPGETAESFAEGFNQLVELSPDEIQVGILKRLKGFPLARHDQKFEMAYDKQSPYQILKTKDLDFLEMQNLARFAKTWDLIANSGNFSLLMKTWKDYCRNHGISFFMALQSLNEFLYRRHAKNYGLSLMTQLESLYIYFSENKITADVVKLSEILAMDYSFQKRRDLPFFLKKNLSVEFVEKIKQSNIVRTNSIDRNVPQRQQKHAIKNSSLDL